MHVGVGMQILDLSRLSFSYDNDEDGPGKNHNVAFRFGRGVLGGAARLRHIRTRVLLSLMETRVALPR